jgi:hypothetical protein
MYFKRKPFIGNLMIAILTAIVPILSGLYFHIQTSFPSSGIENLFLPEIESVKESVVIWKKLFIENGNFCFHPIIFCFGIELKS